MLYYEYECNATKLNYVTKVFNKGVSWWTKKGNFANCTSVAGLNYSALANCLKFNRYAQPLSLYRP